MSVGHILIARPDRADAARRRLDRMQMSPLILPAIMPDRISPHIAASPYATFSGSPRPRTPKEHGIALSHLCALGRARAEGWEWSGFWEDDVDGAAGIGWREFALPADCGVLYLGGALWWPKESYGQCLGGDLWRVENAMPISGAHAFMVHRRAIDDILNAYCEMSMTLDDLLSFACIEAQKQGRWSTCFVSPWLAWQQDRPETQNPPPPPP
jgi:hypothetical protein